MVVEIIFLIIIGRAKIFDDPLYALPVLNTEPNNLSK